jgi:hypothetical protein
MAAVKGIDFTKENQKERGEREYYYYILRVPTTYAQKECQRSLQDKIFTSKLQFAQTQKSIQHHDDFHHLQLQQQHIFPQE